MPFFSRCACNNQPSWPSAFSLGFMVADLFVFLSSMKLGTISKDPESSLKILASRREYHQVWFQCSKGMDVGFLWISGYEYKGALHVAQQCCTASRHCWAGRWKKNTANECLGVCCYKLEKLFSIAASHECVSYLTQSVSMSWAYCAGMHQSRIK